MQHKRLNKTKELQ